MTQLCARLITAFALWICLVGPSISFAQSRLSCIYNKLAERVHLKSESLPPKNLSKTPELVLPEIPEPSGDRKIPLLGKSGLQIGWYENQPYAIELDYPLTQSRHLSDLYHVTIFDPEKQTPHKITVIIPHFSHPASGAYDEAYTNQVRNQVFQLMSMLPKRHIDAVKRVKVHLSPSSDDEFWRQTYKIDGTTAASAWVGDINLFPTHFKELSPKTREGEFLHEFGHLVAQKFWKTSNPPQSYINAAERDRYTVSEYGNKHWQEDFAEAVRVYLQTDGGKADPIARQRFSHRFAYIDEIFAIDLTARK
jgi:hypothetical protein